MHYWTLVLECDWEYVSILKPPIVKHLPDILVAEEINRTFGCVYRTHYEVYLYTVYTLGIRLSEALFLQVGTLTVKLSASISMMVKAARIVLSFCPTTLILSSNNFGAHIVIKNGFSLV